MKKLVPFALVAFLTGCPEPTEPISRPGGPATGQQRPLPPDVPMPPGGTAEGGGGGGQVAPPEGIPVGTPALEIAGTTTSGEQISLVDYKGKVVLVDFWATWCGPCIAAMPKAEKLAADFEGRPFAILGVSGDRAEKDLADFLENRPLAWKNIFDPPHGNMGRWKIKYIPTMYLIDAEGVIQHQQIGGGGDHAALEQLVEKLVAEAEAKGAG